MLVSVGTYRLNTKGYKLLYTQARRSYQQAQELIEVNCLNVCSCTETTEKNNKFKFEEPVVNGLVWSNTLKSFFDASE